MRRYHSQANSKLHKPRWNAVVASPQNKEPRPGQRALTLFLRSKMTLDYSTECSKATFRKIARTLWAAHRSAE
jgi:hypothetical protein